jgi:agmatine deiminase
MSIYMSKAMNELYPEIMDIMLNHIKVKEIDSPNLWVRDYMPIKIENTFYKFLYKGYDGFPQLQVSEDCWKRFNPFERDIYLDGGNIVQDENVVFISNQVFKHNSHLIKGDLTQFLKDIFNKQIIFLPVEPEDDLGHADGIIKIIDKSTVLINDYRSWISQSWYEYAIRLERVLKDNNYDFIKIPWALNKCPQMTEVEFRRKYPYADDYNPGFGYYINYYQTQHHVFVPQFNLIEDVPVMILMHRIFKDHEIVPVDCKDISMLGGLMNCITWED